MTGRLAWERRRLGNASTAATDAVQSGSVSHPTRPPQAALALTATPQVDRHACEQPHGKPAKTPPDGSEAWLQQPLQGVEPGIDRLTTGPDPDPDRRRSTPLDSDGQPDRGPAPLFPRPQAAGPESSCDPSADIAHPRASSAAEPRRGDRPEDALAPSIPGARSTSSDGRGTAGSSPGSGQASTCGIDAPTLASTPVGFPTARPAEHWRLRALPVCASTETELDSWLQHLITDPRAALPGPVAVIARRQRFGRGQQGRVWSSPAGGVWLSAALPWHADPASAAAPGLAAAVGLALELEALGLTVRLKWPNDLLLMGTDGRLGKVAGLLPRLRLRGGQIRWARLGIGLNGCNPVPAGASNLRAALGAWQARPQRLAARLLRGLEWAAAMADQPQAVRQLAEQRLLVMPGSWEGACEGWQPLGLADDGALVLARGDQRQLLRRRFEPA